ncbi:hypothetical protein EJ04DRAFT_594415 [Polyplosphaeria fusca]|uniref:ferric-chelate reductase (NADPH) n=1 Tax=Polyplosphaeria fusca TaxID=682080 RepID=A0A9P4QHV1_9PLEO|nr:hypothetical protein EJ04DRAFT_594415 [Polyplosphaeria fusca]
MYATLIYLISTTSAVGLYLLWKLSQLISPTTRWKILFFLRKRLLYSLVLRRRKGTSEITVSSFLGVAVIVAANVTASTIKLRDRTEFAKRCGTLFLINLVPLYLGGRSSIIVDRILRVPCSQYLLLHKWLGRICVIQGIVHGISSATATTFTVVEILLLSLLGAVGCLSFLYVRRYMYEVFLKVHLISALALLGTLYFHKHLLRNRSAIGLGIASGLWLVQQVIRIIRILYRNSGSRTAGSLLLHRFPSLNAPVQCLDATITLKNAWKVEPGQYVYLSLPSISRHRAGFLQSHPYTVAWSDDATVTLLIQRAAGFSNTIFETSKQQSSVIVDGPYGKEPPIQDFDKVLYIASGIGIAAHLLSIRQLLQDHENQSARVRRLTLLWFLETRGKFANAIIPILRYLIEEL